jgi:hypothetical protein
MALPFFIAYCIQDSYRKSTKAIALFQTIAGFDSTFLAVRAAIRLIVSCCQLVSCTLPDPHPEVRCKNNLELVCHESNQFFARNYTKDEGRSFGVGLQERAKTTLSCCGKEPWVVSVKEKARQDWVRYGSWRRTQVNH